MFPSLGVFSSAVKGSSWTSFRLAPSDFEMEYSSVKIHGKEAFRVVESGCSVSSIFPGIDGHMENSEDAFYRFKGNYLLSMFSTPTLSHIFSQPTNTQSHVLTPTLYSPLCSTMTTVTNAMMLFAMDASGGLIATVARSKMAQWSRNVFKPLITLLPPPARRCKRSPLTTDTIGQQTTARRYLSATTRRRV